jgi:hypothetical protein
MQRDSLDRLTSIVIVIVVFLALAGLIVWGITPH